MLLEDALNCLETAQGRGIVCWIHNGPDCTVTGKDRIQLQNNLELNEEFFIYTPSNNN